MMNKVEFLNELSSSLSSLPKSERDDLIQYYDELIEDRKERTNQSEEEIIASLGSIDEIVRKTTGIKKEKIVIDDPEIVSSYKEIKSKNKSSNNNTILKAVIFAITFPIWIGLVLGFIGCLIGFFASGVGLGIGGIACLIGRFFVLSSSIGDAILHMGCGCILIGLSLIIVPSLIKFFIFLFNESKSFIEKIF